MDEALMQEAREFMAQELPSLSGRGRGAGSLEAMARVLTLSSVGLNPPRRVVLRPAAETLAGMKLSQVAARLREERQVLGVTLPELHDETGITCGRLSRLEQGIDTNPTIGTLERLAEGLGIQLVVTFAAAADAEQG